MVDKAVAIARPELNLLRTLSTVSGMTLLSRITGLLRAAYLGDGTAVKVVP